TALLLGITGCSSDGGSDAGGNDEEVKPLSGIGIDGILMQSIVCIDKDESGTCDDGEITTQTDNDGKFEFPAGTQSGPLILSGGIDKSTGKTFKGVLKAPAGSAVITPLTSAIQSLMDNNSSISAEDAQATIKKAMGLGSVDVSLTEFDPYNGIDGENAQDAQQILAKQTQLQILVHTAAATIAGADSDTNVDDAMSNVFDSIVKSMESGAEVEIDAKTLAIVTREAAAKTYEDSTNKDALVVAVGTVAQAEAEDAVIAANGAKQTIIDGDAQYAIGTLDGAINAVNDEDGSSSATAVSAQSKLTAEELTAIIEAREAEDAAAKEAAEKEAKAVIAREEADKALNDATTKAGLEAAEKLRVLAAEAEKLAAEKAAAEAEAAKVAAAKEAAIDKQEAADKLAEAQAGKAAADAIALQAKIEAEAAQAAVDAINTTDEVDLDALKEKAEEAAKAEEQTNAKELVGLYVITANTAVDIAQNSVSIMEMLQDANYDINTTVVIDAKNSAVSIATGLSNYNATTAVADLNTTYAALEKDKVLAQTTIVADALKEAYRVKGAEDTQNAIAQGIVDRIAIIQNSVSDIDGDVAGMLTTAITTKDKIDSDASYMASIASMVSDAQTQSTQAQTLLDNSTDALEAANTQATIITQEKTKIATALSGSDEAAAIDAQLKVQAAQTEFDKQFALIKENAEAIAVLAAAVKVIENANKPALEVSVTGLMDTTKVATVADAKNMFTQLRETTLTFVDLENMETNSSTIVGSQINTVETKLQPAVENIVSGFEASATEMESSLESFTSSIEADFNTTVHSITDRIEALTRQTEQYNHEQNWTVTTDLDTLSHSYVNNSGTTTDTFTLNSQSITLVGKKEENGDTAPEALSTSGAIAFAGTGYSLNITSLSFDGTKALIQANGKITGENDAEMSLTTLKLSVDADTSINDFNMFQNPEAMFEGAITTGGRTLNGSLALYENATSTLSGSYIGLSTEPSFDGNVTLTGSLNSLIDDSANNKGSYVDSWNPLLMVTVDGKESLATSWTEFNYTSGATPEDGNGNYVYYHTNSYIVNTQDGNVTCDINQSENIVYNHEYGYYQGAGYSNSVTCSDDATLIPYYTTSDKITVDVNGEEKVVDNAWYNWDSIYDETSGEYLYNRTLKIHFANDGETYSDENGILFLDGEAITISNVQITERKNLFDRTFDFKVAGEFTHGSKKVAASFGIDRGAESKLFAQDIEITDGVSFVKVDELSVVLQDDEFLKRLDMTGGDDYYYYGEDHSQFENYYVEYNNVYYDNSDDDLDLKKVLSAKLENLQVSLADTEADALTLDANVSIENRANISISLDGSYEYKTTKFSGHIDANGLLTELADGETEVIGVANVSGSVESNGFAPFDIVTMAKFSENESADIYSLFTRGGTYQLGARFVKVADSVTLNLADSNGVFGSYQGTTEDSMAITVTDKDANKLADFGEATTGNSWEIKYTDNSSETLF
ncbi:MAG: hypothetical protein U9N39_08815, partial [Campylobacterota bacterium]|nr:hypothetical protein [Campylobacterota bacterium]